MTAITLSTMPQVAAIATTMRRIVATLGDAIDAFAAYRMQHAVPEHELRRAEDEIERYRRTMHASRQGVGR